MVAVDHRTPEVCRDPVELVAEFCHFGRAVLIAGDNLVDRVDHNSGIIVVLCPPEQFGHELVHGDRFSPQVPDINVFQMMRRNLQCRVNIAEPVQAARPVKLQVDVQDPAALTLPSKPWDPFGDTDNQVDLEVGLSGLGGP